MYKTHKQLKKAALNALSGKWALATPMALIMYFVSVSLSYNSSNSFGVTVLPILSSLLTVIMTVGFYSFLLKLLCGQKDKATFIDLFYGFQCKPGKALLLYLLTMLYMLPGTMVYIIGICIFIFVIYASAGVSMDLMMAGAVPADTTLMLAVLVMVIIMTVLYMLYAFYIDSTYSLVYFLLLDYPDLSVTEIWKRSRKLMKGNRLRFIGLELSFIPWILLCICSLGIGMLWITPYMYAANTAFYVDLVQKNAIMRRQAAAAPSQSYPSYENISDTNLSHDCEAAHPETRSKDGNDYSGIDPNTFK